MDFIKMIMELPGEKRSQDVVEHTEWNSLWKLIVTQGNHSENYLEQLYDYFFNKEEGWVHKVQAELDGVQPYVEGAMTQPVGKAPDGSLWTYPSTESGTVPWGNVMGDITKQQDLIQKFATKADVEHRHSITTLTFNEGDIDSSWINYSPQSVPTSALENLSVTTEKLNNGAVTSAKIASSAVINNSIANGAVSGAKITDGAITRVKLAQDALYSPIRMVQSDSNIVSSDVGATIRTGGSASAIKVTLTQAVSQAMPVGTEIAFLPWVAATMKIAFNGVKVGVSDQTQPYTSPTFTLKHKGMIAIKKILSDSNGDYWLLSGPTEEVVT